MEPTTEEAIFDRLTRLEERLDHIVSAMDNVEKAVKTVISEVRPTPDSLMGNPMLRMALGIKK